MAKILIATPELAELAPVGGIAEYVLGLARALARAGHDVRIALPLYDFLARREDLTRVKDRVVVRLGLGASEVTSVHRLDLQPSEEDGVVLPVMLLGNHKHFVNVRQPGDIYDWPDHEPWIAFSRAVVDWLLQEKDWQPDVVHCQDAHTALVPLYIERLRASVPFAATVATVLTIHNLLNQGGGPRELMAYAGLPMDCFDRLFEYYGGTNCFKAGLLTADMVNTVSRTYAREICESSEYGFGLEGVLRLLRDRRGNFLGIVNGIDERRWVMDGLKYDGSDSMAKVSRARSGARRSLFRRLKWKAADGPVVAFRARWDEQKGVRLLVEALPAMAEIARLVIVTWGTPGPTSRLQELWQALNALAAANPGRIAVNPDLLIAPGATVTHYALADFFLMPSRYEPCGLAQQECQRFGTVPIVRATGGLADTVAEEEVAAFPSPNGYVFRDFHSGAMLDAVRRAVGDFPDPEKRRALVETALRQRNDWDNRLAEYEELYERAMRRRA